ncbi:MAG TPA: hypothetical protein VF789_25375 [Thermoanaerobaculia bacterium]
MKIQTFLKAAALASLLVLPPAGAQQSDRADGMRFVPNVYEQFRALTQFADPIGFHISTTPNPSMCRHYQAITRVDGADGTPFFLVTRSGNTPDIPILPDELACDDSPGETRNGNLIVFRMGSRDKHGERLRSNRLRKGVHVDQTQPPAEDVATIFFTIVGGDPDDPDPAKRPGLVFRNGEGPGPVQRVYQHPGGMQLVGHMLAIANETPKRPMIPNPDSSPEFPLPPIPDPSYDVAPHPTAILFFDVSDPEDPAFRSQFAPMDGPADDPDSKPLKGADGLGVTPLPGGLYLMSVKGGFEEEDPIFFYRSTTGDLSSRDLKWEFVAKTKVPEVEDSHQTFQFLREGNIHGDLYMAGARGTPNPFASDRDRIDLFHVHCDTEDCAPGEGVYITFAYHGQRISPFPSTGGTRLANTAAATGFHVTPSGELIFYATEHDNDGPNETVKAGEWRHRNMVREGSPTMLPRAVASGPSEVDEGSDVSLSGAAEPPITRAWIQLFNNTDFSGLYPTVDYRDYDLDNFDNFFALEPRLIPAPPTTPPSPPTLVTLNDKARSWKWYAPAGCSIFAMDFHQGALDEARTLAGDDALHEDSDLLNVLNDGGTDDINEELDAVDFLDNCDQYYASPFVLRWDLDLDGSFEATGSPVIFQAVEGPQVVSVPARAQHPAGGPVGEAAVKIKIRNVAPQLTPLRVTDSAGHLVNVEVPFVLTGVPVTAAASFTDPGLIDHQTATLAWGDGLADPQTAFNTFDEAFGDGTGAVSHAHRYTLAGLQTIELSVSDDDAGVDTESVSVRVLTPEQAVLEILARLDQVIAGTTDREILKDLEKARRGLAGNPNGNTGALKEIRAGNDQAAVAFLEQAVFWLREAQADGADVALLTALLEQVVASLSAA